MDILNWGMLDYTGIMACHHDTHNNDTQHIKTATLRKISLDTVMLVYAGYFSR
jgi:hypothetical protein